MRRPAAILGILYSLSMYNRAIWRNETNSSESSGFPGLSANFFPSALIFIVDSKKRQAAQRPLALLSCRRSVSSVDIAPRGVPTRNQGKRHWRRYFATFPRVSDVGYSVASALLRPQRREAQDAASLARRGGRRVRRANDQRIRAREKFLTSDESWSGAGA